MDASGRPSELHKSKYPPGVHAVAWQHRRPFLDRCWGRWTGDTYVRDILAILPRCNTPAGPVHEYAWTSVDNGPGNGLNSIDRSTGRAAAFDQQDHQQHQSCRPRHRQTCYDLIERPCPKPHNTGGGPSTASRAAGGARRRRRLDQDRLIDLLRSSSATHHLVGFPISSLPLPATSPSSYHP